MLLPEDAGPRHHQAIARQFNLGKGIIGLVPDGDPALDRGRGLFHLRLVSPAKLLVDWLLLSGFDVVLTLSAGELAFGDQRSEEIAREILDRSAPAVDSEEDDYAILAASVAGQSDGSFTNPAEGAALVSTIVVAADCSCAIAVKDAENVFPAGENDKGLLDNPRIWRELTDARHDALLIYVTRSVDLLHPCVRADIGEAVVRKQLPTEPEYVEFLRDMRILHSGAFDGHSLEKLAEAAHAHNVGYRALWRVIEKYEALPMALSPEEIKKHYALSKPEGSKLVLTEKPNASLADVAGLDQAKAAIRRRVVYPVTHREAASRYRKRAGGGVLLYGPPGTGKTMVARAIAGEVDAVFYSVSVSDIMSKWVGEAEKNMRQLFEDAWGQERSVIFFDEIEALVSSRGKNSSVMDRLIPQFLSLVDGVEGRRGSVLLLGATNRPWDMDKAALRPGRFDELIYVGPPNAEARAAILTANLKDVPQEDDLDLRTLAARLDGFSGADIMGLVERITDCPYERDVKTGRHQLVTAQDIEDALLRSKPSITEAMLARFEEFANERS